MGSRAGNRPWLWQWPSLRMMELGNGVRLGLLQASLGGDHGALCRYRRIIGKRKPVRCRRDRADRARGQGGQRARDPDRLVPRPRACDDADWAGSRTAVAVATSASPSEDGSTSSNAVIIAYPTRDSWLRELWGRFSLIDARHNKIRPEFDRNRAASDILVPVAGHNSRPPNAL